MTWFSDNADYMAANRADIARKQRQREEVEAARIEAVAGPIRAERDAARAEADDLRRRLAATERDRAYLLADRVIPPGSKNGQWEAINVWSDDLQDWPRTFHDTKTEAEAAVLAQKSTESDPTDWTPEGEQVS